MPRPTWRHFELWLAVVAAGSAHQIGQPLAQMLQTKEQLERLTKSILAILTLALAAGAGSQQSPTISTGTNVVMLYATVHDADGRVVKNLNQDDFLLLEDGVPQKITYFSPELDLPLTIGLLVDAAARLKSWKKSAAPVIHFSIKSCARARIRHS